MSGYKENPNIAPVTRTKVRTINTASQQSAAFGVDSTAITIWADVDDAWIMLGVNPVAVATEGEGRIALPSAGIPITLPITPGQKFAGIAEVTVTGKIKCLEHPYV